MAELQPRSLLFVPGGRPDMVAKLPRSAPDAVAVDLEDAVAAGDKESARIAALEALAALPDMPGTVLLVRVNPPGTPWYEADVAAVADSRAAGAVLPKLEPAAGAAGLRRLLGRPHRPDPVIVGGLETAAGVAAARELAGEVDAVYFGAEDYAADVGGRRTPGGLEVLHARSEVVIAARLAGVAALDQVVPAVHDDQRFVADAEAGRNLGYDGKMCLHPRQVELAHQVFAPSTEEVRHARSVVEAAAAGVGMVDGEMVDDVHRRMAEAVLRRAGAAPA